MKRGNGLALRCVQTTLGDPDESGRRAPVNVPGTEHDIACGMVIAAVGQKGLCDDLDRRGLMLPDRVRTDWDGMRTDDPKVFAAGDGAFGGSTIVMAMHHGQRVAYYVKAFLEGRADPLPYRTPHRTRRVPVAQDLNWELLPIQHPDFLGLGETPVEFPEIETTYGWDAARDEAARCFRCDAETGSADYAVDHREDIFAMARTNPVDSARHKAMLAKRLGGRDDPFPEGRPGVLDDLTFLPANLSRLVIDPYREACRIDTAIGGVDFALPLLVTGFDDAPEEVARAAGRGIAEAGAGHLGRRPLAGGAPLGSSWRRRTQRRTRRRPASSRRSAAASARSRPHGRAPAGSRASPSPRLRFSKRRSRTRWTPASTCSSSTAAAAWARRGRNCGARRTSRSCATPSPICAGWAAKRRSIWSGSAASARAPTRRR